MGRSRLVGRSPGRIYYYVFRFQSCSPCRSGRACRSFSRRRCRRCRGPIESAPFVIFLAESAAASGGGGGGREGGRERVRQKRRVSERASEGVPPSLRPSVPSYITDHKASGGFLPLQRQYHRRRQRHPRRGGRGGRTTGKAEAELRLSSD